MTIACATHFTESSFSALKVAAALARKRHEQLSLINVQDGFAPTASSAQHQHHDARNALRLEASAVAADGVTVETSVQRGPLAPTVWGFCNARRASMIVVGDTHHLTSPLFETPLDKLAHGVAIPLLVVRDEKPLLTWLDGPAPLKVLVALDHRWTQLMARDWIKQLAGYGPVDLVVCHLWSPAAEYERRGLPPQAEPHQLATMIRGEAEMALVDLPDNVTHRLHLEICHGPVAERLLEISVDEHVDLFVIGTHLDQGPLARRWSVAHDVLGLAPMSVACVPTPPREVEHPKPTPVITTGSQLR